MLKEEMIQMNSLLTKFTFTDELTDVIENCKGVFVPTSKAELYDMVFGPEHADVYDVVFDVPGQVTIVGLVIAWVLRCDHSQRMNRAGNRHIQHMGIIHKICDDIVNRSQNDCILLPPLKLVDGVHLISISQLLADGVIKMKYQENPSDPWGVDGFSSN